MSDTTTTETILDDLAVLDEARPDPFLLRIGLVGLVVIAIIALGLAGAGMLLGKTVPDLFVAIPSAAVGSIGTLLIPSTRR